MPRPRKALYETFTEVSAKCQALSAAVKDPTIPFLRSRGGDRIADLLARLGGELQTAVDRHQSEIVRWLRRGDTGKNT
jgi:hypothetical protein